MAREFGKVWFSMFTDEHFTAQPTFDKLLYISLLAQPALNYAGILPLNFKRLAKAMRDGAIEAAEMTIKAALNRLEANRYVFTDPETGECLVRSLMRRDEVWRQPFVFVSALNSVAAVESPKLAAVLVEELERIDFPVSTNAKAQTSLDKATKAAFDHVRPLAKGSPRGSARPFPEADIQDEFRGSPKGSPRPSVVVEVEVEDLRTAGTHLLKKNLSLSHVSNASEGERETSVEIPSSFGPRRDPIPDDWTPNELHYSKARQLALIGVDQIAEDFRNHALGAGRLSANWDADFSRWLASPETRRRQPMNGKPVATADRKFAETQALKHTATTTMFGELL